jgi:hypothetical protein
MFGVREIVAVESPRDLDRLDPAAAKNLAAVSADRALLDGCAV